MSLTLSGPEMRSLGLLLTSIRERVEIGERLRNGSHEFPEYLTAVRAEEERCRAFCATAADVRRQQIRDREQVPLSDAWVFDQHPDVQRIHGELDAVASEALL